MTVFSQISELNFSEFNYCIPSKFKDTINSVDLRYKQGVLYYNDAISNSLDDKSKIDKLTKLFLIQKSTYNTFQDIWLKGDSLSKENSSKYFIESKQAYSSLTDTINFSKLEFKSSTRALVIVEKAQQIIQLQKFGIQVLFNCVKENTGGLSQLGDPNIVLVNIDMIERFRKVWNEANYPTTYDKWVYKPSERKPFLAKTYAEYWREYKYGIKKEAQTIDSTKPVLVAENLQTTELTKSDLKEKQNLADNSRDLEGSKNDKSTKGRTGKDVKGDKNQQTTQNENIEQRDVQTYTVKGEGKKIEISQKNLFEIKTLSSKSNLKSLGIDYFTIQIAASKNQLVTERLRKDVYTGDLNIEEKNESGWYKYVIGHFSSFDSANQYLAKPCVIRGFVSGYGSKGRVAILSIKQPIVIGGSTSTYSIVYRVQIAASRQPLTREMVSRYYKGFNPVNVSREDGWYRYSIGDYIYYDDAKIAKDSCGINGAFVMPYQNGKRVMWPSKEALNLLKQMQNSSPIYVVQVAASRNPIALEVIQNIIKVDYPLTLKYEDGWYKYYISAFTDFAYAKEIAAKIGIKGAFIATYKNGSRVNP